MLTKKILLSVTVLLACLCHIQGQSNSIGINNNCCVEHPEWINFIDCDTTKLKGELLLYRQFSCDSSWLTLEKKDVYKKVLFSLGKELIELTPKLGYQFRQDYSSTILFKNRESSGGGFPSNAKYALVSKESGELIKNLEPILYYSDTSQKELIVMLELDSIPSLVFYSPLTNEQKSYKISSSQNEFTRFMNADFFPQQHFDNAKYLNGVFTIDYNYKKNEDSSDWTVKSIVVKE